VIVLDVLGTQVGVTATDASLADAVSTLWAPFASSSGSPARQFVLETADIDPVAVVEAPGSTRLTGRANPLLAALGSAINQLALDGCPHLAIHAGVVSAGHDAIAFPAASGVGKSTLTAACLRSGFRYCSDEALVLPAGGDPDRPAAVAPYPRPIALSPWSATAVGLPVMAGVEERLATPGELGSGVPDGPVQLRHVVDLRRVSGAQPELEQQSRAATLQLLVLRSFNHYKDPAATFRLLAAGVASLTMWRLTYDDPIAAAGLLRSALVDRTPLGGELGEP
jgi:hypothetical protein